MKKKSFKPYIILPVLLSCFCLFNPSIAQEEQSKGIDLSNMDKSVSPGQNFFQYVNGNWLKKSEIPSSEGGWGSFNEVTERNREIIKNILEETAKKSNPTKGSNEQIVGDLYASGMDSMAIEKAGINPIQMELDKIDAIQNNDELISTIARLHTYSIGPAFGFFVLADLKNSKMNAAYLWQGGLGLPDRSYYLEDTEQFKKYRVAYQNHIAKMLAMGGEKSGKAKKYAQNILALETRLAKASRTPVQNRDIPKLYNKKTSAELKQLASNINWVKYFEILGKTDIDEIIVGQPEFFEELNKTLKEVPIDTWIAYLKWNLLSSAAPYLSSEFATENFTFFSTVLRGIKEQRPRWKRIQQTVNSLVGEPLGAMYVEKAFPPEAKERMQEMIENLKEAFAVRIIELDWMSSETKVQALKKLNAIIYKIGYPDKWRDYSGLDIQRGDYAGNVMRANLFEHQFQMAKIGKPVDKTEWGMTPPTVNAYYNPTVNEIVFPAGILQPPFFDFTADDAVNYGAIGAVIGHELTHGFDDQGSQFDAEGNLSNWWTEEDLKKFKEKTKAIIEQYSNYTVLNNVKVNGELTVGENIADLGGVTIAFEALKRSWKKKGKPEPIDGFTPEQRFFIGFGQIWRSKYRDEVLLERIKTDPHSPGLYRSNGTLSNFPLFFEIFNVEEGTPMRLPKEKITVIW